ncbi:hypothetical protein SAMN05444166_1374 [Singulisphaera sp. GP187]|uniref:hypothetical protein n=1 Tax=Singulisphaera sp. GP187 TaxID=1882752 RepID=UPI0009295599|nr:hypothetical protein [Singulisphaera sp. GP187]SIN87247.1 hypothetical protein SAMN05444166_1374 [Singulisphaera sp. GP187]
MLILPHLRFTVWRMMVGVAIVGVALGGAVWLRRITIADLCEWATQVPFFVFLALPFALAFAATLAVTMAQQKAK